MDDDLTDTILDIGKSWYNQAVDFTSDLFLRTLGPEKVAPAARAPVQLYYSSKEGLRQLEAFANSELAGLPKNYVYSPPAVPRVVVRNRPSEAGVLPFNIFPDASSIVKSAASLADNIKNIGVQARNVINTSTSAIDRFGTRLGTTVDYLTGRHNLPQIPDDADSVSKYVVPQLSDKTKGVLRGSLVVLPGLRTSFLRPALGAHLVFDALTGYADFRNPNRSAFQGLPALVEPYLAMVLIGASATAADALEALHEEVDTWGS